MKKSLLLFGFLSLAACSSGGGGGAAPFPGEGLPQPTAEQTNRAQTVSQELVDVQGAAGKHISIDTNLMASKLRNMMVRNENGGFDGVQMSEQGEQYSHEIGAAFGNGSCDVRTEGIPERLLPNSEEFEIPNIDATIQVITPKTSAIECPFDAMGKFKLDFNLQETGNGASFSAKAGLHQSFRAKPWSSLYLGMGITAFTQDFNVGLSGNVTVDPSTGEMSSLNLSVSGQGASTFETGPDFPEQAIAMAHSISLQAALGQTGISVMGQVVADQTYTDFRLVGVAQLSMNGQSEEDVQIRYFINAVETDEETFMKIFGAGMNSAMGTVEDSGLL